MLNLKLKYTEEVKKYRKSFTTEERKWELPPDQPLSSFRKEPKADKKKKSHKRR
jgi:hypothetical protein